MEISQLICFLDRESRRPYSYLKCITIIGICKKAYTDSMFHSHTLTMCFTRKHTLTVCFTCIHWQCVSLASIHWQYVSLGSIHWQCVSLTSIHGQCVLQLSNLIMLTKQKSLSSPRNLALATFGELLMVVPNEVQSEPIRFNDTDVLLPSVADKSELFCWNLF